MMLMMMRYNVFFIMLKCLIVLVLVEGEEDVVSKKRYGDICSGFNASNPAKEELCIIYKLLDQDDDGVVTFDDLERELGGEGEEHTSRASVLHTLTEKHSETSLKPSVIFDTHITRSSRSLSTCTDIPFRNSRFSTEIISSVIWEDSIQRNCQTYSANSLCTSDGGYGTGWPDPQLTFSDFLDDYGYSALDACCACGGGRTNEMKENCIDTSQPNYRHSSYNFQCVNFLGKKFTYVLEYYDTTAIYRENNAFSASTMCCISGGGSYGGPGQYGKAKILCGPGIDQCTDVNRAIDGDLQAYPTYWSGVPDAVNNGPRATNVASCQDQRYLTIELENRYVLTKITAWGKIGSRHCGMRVAISSTGSFDGEEKIVYEAGTTSYSEPQPLKGTVIDINDREPVSHVRWWMSKTETDNLAYFVEIKFEGYEPMNCSSSSYIVVHKASTLSYGCADRTEIISNCVSQHDPSDNPTLWWGNIGENECFRDCSVCSISSSETCNWFETRLNTQNEINLGPASSRSECVQMVRDSCPNAVMAHMPSLGYGDCYCQFVASDMTEQFGVGWSSCLLSSLAKVENDSEDAIDTFEGVRFRLPDLHLSGTQFASESIDSVLRQDWTDAPIVTDAFFTALNLTSSSTASGYVEVANGGYGQVVGLRYTQAYWVKWDLDSTNAKTLFRGKTDHWAQVQASTFNFGFYGDRDGSFRDSGLDINSPSNMWQLIVITGQASDSTREYVFVFSTTGQGYQCAFRSVGSTCAQYTPPQSDSILWGDANDPTTCYSDCIEASSIGTQHVYLGTISSKPVFVGSTDRVATGTQIWRLGDENEGPGLVSHAMMWFNEMLEYDEIEALWESTKSVCHGTKLSSYPSGTPYIYIEDAWRPICGHHFWDNSNGCNTICKNLGYGSGSAVQSRQSYTEDSYWIGKCEPDDDIFYCAGKANSYMYDTFNYYQADNPSCAAGESVSVTCSCENPLFSNAGSDFECDNLNAARDASRRCNNVQGEAYRYVDCGTSTGFLAPICGKVECDTKVTSYNRNQQSNGGYFASTSVPQSSSNPKGSGYAQCLHTSSDLKINDLTCNYCTHTNGGAVDSVGDNCDFYTINPTYCGSTSYDTATFTLNEMCCACGGGNRAGITTCEDCHSVCLTDDASCHISCDKTQSCMIEGSTSDCNPYNLPDGSVSAYYDSCNGPTVNLRATDACMLGCGSGYSGNGAMIYCTKNPSNRNVVSSSLQCSPNACAPLELPSQVETSSSHPACSAGDILTISASCNVPCREGYVGSGGSALCPSNAENNDDVTWSLNCAEVSCNPIYLEPAAGFDFTGQPQGIEGDPTNPYGACTDGSVLTTISNPVCGLRCKTGYHGYAQNVTCASNAIQGTLASSTISCVESSCLAFNGIGIGGVVSDTSTANSCYNNIVLTTGSNPTCSIKCDDGFSGDSGNVVCEENSNDNDPTQTNVTCVENTCAGLTLRSDLVGDFTHGNACTPGMELSTRNAASCDVKCGPGYIAGIGTYECAYDALNNDAATTQMTTCTEVQCNPYSFPDGVEGDDSIGATACSNQVRLGTHTNMNCNLRCMSGYEGTNDILTCASDATYGTDAFTSIVCNEKHCASYSFTAGVTGGSTTDPCTDNITLSTITDPQCTLACRAGYSGAATTLRCSTSISNGDPPTLDDTSFTCSENMCAQFELQANMSLDNVDEPRCNQGITVLSTNTNTTCNFKQLLDSGSFEFKSAVCSSSANSGDQVRIMEYDLNQKTCSRFTFLAGMIPGSTDPCFDGIVLSTHTYPDCNIACKVGFTGVEGKVTCPTSILANGDPPETSVVCTENTCAALNLRSDLVGDSSSSGIACMRDMVLNSYTTSTCNVKCGDGYVTGLGKYVCAPDASTDDPATTQLTCTEVQCNPYTFPDGVEGDDSGGATACSNQVQLGTHTNMNCNLRCMSGYEGTNDILTCASNATYGTDAFTSIVCNEKHCASYSFTAGVTGGSTTDPCTDNITLSTITDPQCTLACRAGYSGAATTLRCSTSISNGDPPTLDDTSFSCTENSCAPIVLANSMYSSHGVSNPCNESQVLGTHTNTVCDLECAEGYFGGAGTAKCNSDASNGDQVQYEISCHEIQCNSYTFGEGVEPDNSTVYQACDNGIRLGTHVNSNCGVKCEAGFQDNQAVVYCPTNASFGQDASNQLQCVPNSCAPFEFNASIFAASSGAGRGISNGCDEGVVLQTRERSQCTLQCLSTHQGEDGTVTCPFNASENQLPEVDITCVEKLCEPLSLKSSETGLEGSTDPCTNGMELSPVTNPTCDLQCAAGYSGDSFTVTCSVESLQPVVTNNIVCTENKCESLIYPRGAVSDTSAESCSRGLQLSTHTNPQCRLECDNGYSGDPGFVRCPSDATQGQAPEFNIACEVDVSSIMLKCGETNGCVEMEASSSSSSGRRRRLTSDDSGGLYNCDASIPLFNSSNSNSTANVSLARFVSTTGGDLIVFTGFQFDLTAAGGGGGSGELVTTNYYLDVNGDRSVDLTWIGDATSFTYDIRMCKANSTENSLICRVPAGSGVENEIQLMRADRISTLDAFNEIVEVVEAHPTKLLDSCRIDFARPLVTAVVGCGIEGCNRTGGNEVEMQGANFGAHGALIFIDGQECRNPIHGNSSVECPEDTLLLDNVPELCHNIVRCTSPALWAAQSGDVSLMVIQSNQFSEPLASSSVSSSFHYRTCGIGNVHNPSNPQLCEKCTAGYFGDREDQLQCEICSAGRFTSGLGMSKCEMCGLNEFSPLGSSTCFACPEGTFSGVESDTCSVCTFWYRLPMLEYGHCEQPFVAYFAALVGFILLLIMMYRCYKSYKEKKKQLHEMKKLLKARHDDMELMSSAWLIQWDELELKQQLASGGFGEVHRGTLRGRYDVAIKIIFDSKGINIEEDKEIRFLKRARHPRLVLFLGCGVRSSDNSIFLVLEFCEEKTLEILLYGDPTIMPPSWDVRLRLLKDAAEGMMHLHLILKTLHRDLKSPNILLNRENGKLRGKVADFGTARWTDARAEERLEQAANKKKKKKKKKKRTRGNSFMNLFGGSSSNKDEIVIDRKEMEEMDLRISRTSVQSNASSKSSDSRDSWQGMNMTAGTGSLLWMAPELVNTMSTKKRIMYSPAVDVYSFGIVLSEALALRQPWSVDTQYHKFTYMLMDAVCAGVRPTIDSNDIADAPPGYVNLMTRCWAHMAVDRPGFDEINMILEDMINARYHYQKNALRPPPPTPTHRLKKKQESGLGDEIGLELTNLVHQVKKNNPFTVTNFVKMMDGTSHAESETEKDLNKIFDLDCPLCNVPEWPGAYIPPTILPYTPGNKIKVKQMYDPTKKKKKEEDGESTSKPIPFTLGSRKNIMENYTASEIDEIIVDHEEKEEERGNDDNSESKLTTQMTNESDGDRPPAFSKKSTENLNVTLLNDDDDRASSEMDFWNSEDNEMFTNSIRHLRKAPPKRPKTTRKMQEKQQLAKKEAERKKKKSDEKAPKKLPTGTGVWGI